eukprot:1188158-Prorocentrum_minimum.AAC.1
MMMSRRRPRVFTCAKCALAWRSSRISGVAMNTGHGGRYFEMRRAAFPFLVNTTISAPSSASTTPAGGQEGVRRGSGGGQ